MRYLLIYLVIINVIALLTMGFDKRRAKNEGWRVPEKTLFLLSLIGGSLGSLIGMYLFRHKTRHWYFVIGMPLILLIHIGLAILVFYLS